MMMMMMMMYWCRFDIHSFFFDDMRCYLYTMDDTLMKFVEFYYLPDQFPILFLLPYIRWWYTIPVVVTFLLRYSVPFCSTTNYPTPAADTYIPVYVFYLLTWYIYLMMNCVYYMYDDITVNLLLMIHSVCPDAIHDTFAVHLHSPPCQCVFLLPVPTHTHSDTAWYSDNAYTDYSIDYSYLPDGRKWWGRSDGGSDQYSEKWWKCLYTLFREMYSTYVCYSICLYEGSE